MYGAWISPHCPMPCRIRLGTLTFDSHCQCQAVPGPPLQCKQPLSWLTPLTRHKMGTLMVIHPKVGSSELD